MRGMTTPVGVSTSFSNEGMNLTSEGSVTKSLLLDEISAVRKATRGKLSCRMNAADDS